MGEIPSAISLLPSECSGDISVNSEVLVGIVELISWNWEVHGITFEFMDVNLCLNLFPVFKDRTEWERAISLFAGLLIIRSVLRPSIPCPIRFFCLNINIVSSNKSVIIRHCSSIISYNCRKIFCGIGNN